MIADWLKTSQDSGSSALLPGGIPSVVDRLRQWEIRKKEKAEQKKKLLEREDLNPKDLLPTFKPKVVLSKQQAAGFLSRMTEHALRKVEAVRDFEDRVQEGLSKLGFGGKKKKKVRKRTVKSGNIPILRPPSGRAPGRYATTNGSNSDSDSSSESDSSGDS